MFYQLKYKFVDHKKKIHKVSIILVFYLIIIAPTVPAQSSSLMEKVAVMDKTGLFILPVDEFTGERSDDGVGRDDPLLIEENYNGFNIVEDRGVFYGVNMADWPLNIRSVQGEAEFPWVMDLTLKKVKLKIDATNKTGFGGKGELPIPILMHKGYRGHNIIKVSKFYYGLEQSKWPMDKKAFLEFIKTPTFTAINIDDAKARIDRILDGDSRGLSMSPPVLVKEDYKGYNIVYFENLFYAVNQAEGPMNIWEIKDKAKYPWDVAKSLEKAQKRVDAFIVNTSFRIKVRYFLKSLLPAT